MSDGLGHGADQEHRVGSNRRLTVIIGITKTGCPQDAVTIDDGARYAGDLVLGHLLLEVLPVSCKYRTHPLAQAGPGVFIL